jgi:nucleoside phosphorylase
MLLRAINSPAPQDLEQRKELARLLLDQGAEQADLELEPAPTATATLTADLEIPFPENLAPIPQPISPAPSPDDPMPAADVLVVTWTVAEVNALADVLTPGQGRNAWYRYARFFDEKYRDKIRPGAPSQKAQRLGSYFPTKVGDTSVVCVKSELHLNQDGISTGDGTATLPVKDFFAQMIEEVKPKLVMTIGTSGGVDVEQNLGDAMVTRAAKFRLNDEFKNEPFNGKTYKSEWDVPTSHFAAGEELMKRYADSLAEPIFLPPTKRYGYDGPPLENKPPNIPQIWLDGGGKMPAFHPVLTTDFFEFGTSSNNLGKEGCAVEMGDAVLGLLCSELPDPPNWLIVRNLSDPQINGDLPTTPKQLNMQAHWAVWYYEVYGYWTSACGALATWAVIAGLDQSA